MMLEAILSRAWRTMPISALLLLLPVSIVVANSQGAPATPLPADGQWWKGVIEVPGRPLLFSIEFRPGSENQKPLAFINIPIQGAKDLPLENVVYSDQSLGFAIPAPANAVFKLQRSNAGVASGTMEQHGMTFSVSMEITTKEGTGDLLPPRPQTPVPPFPYEAKDVHYVNTADNTNLAGTLTIPSGSGKHPAVLLISGSGAQDRDETIFGHKLFFVLADHLTRRGIAVLRVDDRGVGGSSGSTMNSTSEDLAGDVAAGMDFLKKQSEVDGKRIALLGHSEGGVIAPLVASRGANVACIVSMAGSVLPGDKLLNAQLEAALRAAGSREDWIEEHSRIHRRLLSLVTSDSSEDSIRASLRELITHELSASGTAPEQGKVDALVDQQYRFVASPWMRWFLKHDPRASWAKVTCPSLVLIGSLDFQVPPRENLAALKDTMLKTSNRDVTSVELQGLNHLFQTARTGLLQEYQSIEETIAPQALARISDWLCEQLDVKTSSAGLAE